MKRRNVLIASAVVVLAAAAVAANFYYRRDRGIAVTTDVIRARDLEALVSASGKIQPKRLVNISADTPGRVVDLAVNEGERVTLGQFLLQIDPRSLRTRVDSGTASLQAAQMQLDQMKQTAETARAQLEQAERTLKRQQDLWSRELTTREALERAMNDVKVAQSAVQEREHAADAQASRIEQERASLESARYDLNKVRIESPIDGIVTRRNIQEGETAVVGTMNNPGTVLLTLADMSVIQAEVEVDETNIPSVQLGQKATISIDALPDRTFRGHVTEIGNSPIQAATGNNNANTAQATNFKVVVVLDERVPDVRPGFTCTADIVTATRTSVLSVPIPAVAVRELIYDASGEIVRAPPVERPRADTAEPVAPVELEPGQTRRETEGVFVIREGRAQFLPIEVGIAGDRYFEVLSGLRENDEVITGPYNSVRGLADGDLVRVDREGENR
jgi:HlyD family secretion protein